MRYFVSVVVWLVAFWHSNALMSGPTSIMLSRPAYYSSIYYNNGLPSGTSRRNQQQQQILVRRIILQRQMARTPELSEWVLNRNGSITGIVKYHPIYDDGDGITTSILADIKSVGPNQYVTTKSGSAYKLVGEGAAFSKKYIANTRDSEGATLKKPTPDVLSNAAAAVTGGFLSFFAGASPPTTLPKSPSLSTNQDGAASTSQQQKQSSQYKDLSGLTFGGGKYLVSGTYKLSTSGKSLIWKAYRANFRGEPTGDLITLKMSSDTDALRRECANYEKLKNNLVSRGAFVNKLDYLPDAKSSDRREYNKHSILVMENGVYNLKEWMSISRGAGLRGKEMRDVAVAAGQCIQAMHSCKLVWTDLKTENFVVVSNPEVSSGATAASSLIVKGIDVESARPFGETPVDYSPEACPPEFAQAFFAGNALQFSLQPSYDMWSLGMMLFEISTGTPYFFLKPPSVVTKTLSTPAFKPKVNAIQDPKLRNLVEKCLSIDPDDRPTITQFLLHPYFTTSGIGPFSF
jgi:hypothetical protein